MSFPVLSGLLIVLINGNCDYYWSSSEGDGGALLIGDCVTSRINGITSSFRTQCVGSRLYEYQYFSTNCVGSISKSTDISNDLDYQCGIGTLGCKTVAVDISTCFVSMIIYMLYFHV